MDSALTQWKSNLDGSSDFSCGHRLAFNVNLQPAFDH